MKEDWWTALVIVSTLSTASAARAGGFTPVADPAAVVRSDTYVDGGKARFTVLTPRLVRMEWSADGKFEDRASFVFIRRQQPVPKFEVKHDGDTITLRTDALTLRYTENKKTFARENLAIEFTAGGKKTQWNPDTGNRQNLMGTCRTLDGVSGSTRLETGLLSRDGWTLIDDSQRLLFDDGDWPWAVGRTQKKAIDWYFFAYGTDYLQALKDFTAVAGEIPLPPKYVFGGWWSRYWAYSDQELRQLVGEFREHGVPLDVLVVDMDWHLDGWTGYSWNPKYFPDPEGFLKWTKEQGLRVPLNLHPAEGVGNQEKAFEDFCNALNMDPKATGRVAFDCADRRYADAYFKHLHHPLEKQGVDFWWMDWQQGTTSKIFGLDPLWWLNYLHWTDWERDPGAKEGRPLIFSRWGGLGNHRYAIGFSGDTRSNWESLAYQPYFTATAGNVCYPFWSHDIGGHFPGKVEPELYARWIQWGTLSPILRTHAAKSPEAERRIWAFPPEYSDAMKQAWLLRYQLAPYIYTAARQAHDTAMPLVRPLYYLWPELEEAYNHPGEYMFGDDLLVAPVVEPVDPNTRCAVVKVWFPPGDWTHWFTGRRYHGPGETHVLAPLDQVPLFVRDGAMIATTEPGRNMIDKKEAGLIFNVFGGEKGQTRVYEDDGLSQGYRKSECAWTPATFERDAKAGRMTVTIGPVEGSYPGLSKSRRFGVVVHDVPLPLKMRVNGQEQSPITSGAGPGYWYDHAAFALRVTSSESPADKPLRIEIEWTVNDAFESLLHAGLRDQAALLRRVAAALGDKAPEALRAAAQLSDAPKTTASDAIAEWCKLAGHAPRLAKAVEAASLDGVHKNEAIARLLGLATRLSVDPMTDAQGEYEARLEVSVAPPLGATEKLVPEATLTAPASWRKIGDLQRRVQGETVVLTQRLAGDRLAQTVEIAADVQIGQGDSAMRFPIRKTIYPSVNAWWILGPFPKDAADKLDAEIAAMKKPDLTRRFTGAGKEAFRWRRCQRPVGIPGDLTRDFYVNFMTAFSGRPTHVAAYALAMLESPAAREAVLAVGSDDGAVMWLNGKEVYRNPMLRAFNARQERATIALSAGTNVLVVRVEQDTRDWGFSVGLEDAEGRPMTDVKVRME